MCACVSGFFGNKNLFTENMLQMKPWKNLKEIHPTINDNITSPKAKTERIDASAIFLFLRSEGKILV